MSRGEGAGEKARPGDTEARPVGAEAPLGDTEARPVGAEEPGGEAETRLADMEARLAEAETRLAEAEAKVKENWDLFLRARADLENYRKRTERDFELVIARGKRDLLIKLLDVADALERASAFEGQAADPAVTSGAALTYRLLLKVLASEGVTPIECVGQPFNPALHEAVDVRPDPLVTTDTVASELQKGYLHGEEVLRPARVQVSQPPPKQPGL